MRISLRSWHFLVRFLFGFFFLACEVRASAMRKPNRGQKRKRWGRGREEKQWKKLPTINPLRFLKFPFQACERGSLANVWCNMCWSLKSVVVYDGCFFPATSTHYYLGNYFVYRNWIVELFHYQIKVLNFTWRNKCWLLTHKRTNAKVTHKVTIGFSSVFTI